MQHTAQLLWDLSIVRIRVVGETWTRNRTLNRKPQPRYFSPFVIVNRYVLFTFLFFVVFGSGALRVTS